MPDAAVGPDGPEALSREHGDDVVAFASPARLRLADATRHLVDAVLTAEHAPDGELDDVTAAVEELARRLHGAEAAAASEPLPRGRRTRVESGHFDYLTRSPLVGTASPLAPPFRCEVVDGRVLGRGVFHAAYEGPPGYVHGGWVALAFDEVLGMVNVATQHVALTGTLRVRYRRPTPLHREIRLEAWVERTEGRRIVAKGRMLAGDDVTAEAEGLFVEIDPAKALAYFGKARGELGVVGAAEATPAGTPED